MNFSAFKLLVLLFKMVLKGTFIKLPFVNHLSLRSFVLSIFEWLFYKGFTVVLFSRVLL